LEAKGSIEVKCAFYFKVIESKKLLSIRLSEDL